MPSDSSSSRTMIFSTPTSTIGRAGRDGRAADVDGDGVPERARGRGSHQLPAANVTVTPRTGNLLIWNNMDELGSPNDATLHQGMPVEQGTKYILTKWYRERPWCR